MKYICQFIMFYVVGSSAHGLSITQLNDQAPTFWLGWLAVPLILVLLGAVGYFAVKYKRLLRAQNKLDCLWRHVPDVLLEVDENGCIHAVNHPFNPNIPISKIIGRPCEDLLSKGDELLFRHHLQNALQTGQPEHYELSGMKYSKGGHYRQHIVPFYLDNQARALVITSDISEHKEALQILEQAKRQAEEGVKSKLAFMSKVSHEIHSPLKAIHSMVDVIENAYGSDEMGQYSQPLKTSIHHVQRIMEDMKELAKSHSEALTNSEALINGNGEALSLEQTDTSIWNMLDDLEALYIKQAQLKGLDLRLSIADDVPRLLCVDGFRLRQVMYNLLNNAIKFTQQGSIDVHVTRTQVCHEPFIKVSVADTGQGMQKDVQDRIFDAHQSTLESPLESALEISNGQGLGLVICKELVEALGGVIAMESQPGKGSKFWFTLRFKPAKQEDPPLQWSKGHIYLAVLDEQKRQWFAEYFKCLHLPVRQIETQEQIENGENSLLISDHLQPESVRHLWWLGIDYELIRTHGLALSMPYRRDALYQRISDYTSQIDIENQSDQRSFSTKEQQARDSANMQQASVNGTGQGASLGPLLLVEDNLTNQLVIRKTLEKLGYVVEIANNGQEGLDAYQQNNYQAVIMDVQMPVMDGIEATKCIRQLEGPYVPIIALTANTLQEIEEACFAAGMDAYLNKPVDRQVLQSTLETVMENHPRPSLN